ncbi:RraA family protein [Actinophytocola gossypii]|uniref:Putative 4-hydroxy-4-methyl-2-oxoglutarate aldolase n=1 Tax=Actinophytocola gossypii TaxID=2812003 RepID=A0ABT2J1V7_9PSEU|nr:methyltransferase [Actinophytocola gossypii]MCT2581847.1 methyltransferase [Actinophytocola gossypii]
MSECVLYSRPRTAVPDDQVAALGRFPTAAISDGQGRVGGAPGLRPISKVPTLLGTALTVHTRPGDNLAVHLALDVAQPGEILVIAGGGDRERALIGGLACHYAVKRGLGGIVLDGAARDLDELSELELPIFVLDVSHQGPYKDGPGAIGGHVSIRGTSVDTGDVVVGDRDGVVFVPRGEVARAIEGAAAIEANEKRSMAAIAADTWQRPWVDAITVRHVEREDS